MTSASGPVDRATAAASIARSMDSASAMLWVVEAAAGFGRTTVLDRLQASLDEGAVAVLRASGVAWETAHEYGILEQLLGQTGLDFGDAFDAADHLVGGLPGQATLVAVDDAHLADLASLRALATAVRHHSAHRLAVVLTTRTDANHELIDHLQAHRLTLGPMTALEVARYAAAMNVPLTAPQAEHLARHTGGSLRYVASLLATLPVDIWTGTTPQLPVPAPVVARTRERMARLTPSARAVTEAVAILYDPVTTATAGTVAGVEDVLSAVDEAVGAGLLLVRDRVSSVALELPDRLTRAAVREDLGPSRRSQLHRSAAAAVEDPAAALEHAAAATPEADEELAVQLEHLAAERASSGGWAPAAHLYLVATRKSTRQSRERRLLLAVDAMIGAGDVESTAPYVAEIQSFGESAMQNVVLGYLAIVRGRAAEAHARLTRAWELASEESPELRAMIAQRHVLHHLARCEGRQLVAWADRTVELVGGEHPIAVEAQAIRGLGLGGAGYVLDALESYRALQERTGHNAVGQRVRMGAGWLHQATDEIDLARTELTSAVPTDFLGGSQRISLWARCWLARTHFVTGEWDQALDVVEAGVAQVDRSGMVLCAPLLRWTETQIFALRGDWDAARASALAADQGPREYAIMRVPACLGRAALAEARGDYSAVLDALSPVADSAMPEDVSEPGFWPWADVYANALVQEHRYEEAEAFLVHHEQLARDRAHRSSQARLAYARGRLLGARGELAAARRSFQIGIATIDALPLPYDRARIAFAFGQTLRRAGKRREADGIITSARDGYMALGATTYVERCERELRTGGVGTPAGERRNTALTAGELSVAQLVARGQSNRKVAAELFLSVKTVQFHLTRIYSKLGISSRTELAALHLDFGQQGPSEQDDKHAHG